MTTLTAVMLDVAREIGIVREGAATAASTTSLTDSVLSDPPEQYNGGTLWVTSGSAMGAIRRVTRFGEGAFNWTVALPGIQAGDTYAAARPFMSMQDIRQAVLSALSDTNVSLTDTSLAVVSGQEEYTLPSGVADVRRVEVAASAAAPYGYTRNYSWTTQAGILIFDRSKAPTSTGYKIRLWYVGRHPIIDVAGIVNDGVNLNWLKWSAVTNAWRTYISATRKDNPTAQDLFNEAKMNEAGLRARQYSTPPLPRDPHMGVY
jgi:hypothetical protein